MSSKNRYVNIPDLARMSKDALIELIEKCSIKASQFKIKQESLKVLCNGIYGALGNQYFRFYDIRLAEAITLSGQMVIETSRDFFNDYLNGILKPLVKRDYVVILDTDSVYIDFSPLIERVGKGKTDHEIVEFLDKLGKGKMQVLIKEHYDIINEDTNAFEDHLEMKRESIGKAIIVQKKRYVMKVFDNEGVRYKEPEIKIMGLEPVRSTTPAWCRKRLEKAFTMVFDCTEAELQDEIIDARKEFMTLSMKDIASPIGISDLTKYVLQDGSTRSGATQQAKASAAFNRHIKRLNLSDQYPPIINGDKIRVLPLKQPNILREDIVAFKDKLPPEFQIETFVDRDALFEKNYFVPLERFIAVVGWSPEKKFSLDDFFG